MKHANLPRHHMQDWDSDTLRVVVNNRHLTELLAAAASFRENCWLRITENSLSVCVTEPAGVARIEAEVDASVPEATDPFVVPIHAPTVRSLLKNAPYHGDVLLKFNSTEDYVTISRLEVSEEKTHEFVDPKLVAESEPVPDLAPETTVRVDTAKLRGVLRAFARDYDKIEVNVPDDSSLLLDAYDVSGEKQDTAAFSEVEAIGELMANAYSGDFLQTVMDAFPSESRPTLRFANGPMMLRHSDDEREYTAVIAPRLG